jgi:hypothetical protein
MRLLKAGCEYNNHSTHFSGSESARFWLAKRFNTEAFIFLFWVSGNAY